jgi:phosphatidylglycerophosphatase A
VIAAVYAIGVWSASETEQHFGRTDPGPIVLDEVLGMLITLALIPVNPTGAVVGFLLFRALDVVKPWPSGRFEQLHGGLGVMSDDAMAGAYGNVIMRILLALVPIGWLS